MPIKPKDSRNLVNLSACLSDIKSWVGQTFLHLNDNESDVILFGPSKTFNPVNFNLGSHSNNNAHGVKKPKSNSFDAQVKICHSV